MGTDHGPTRIVRVISRLNIGGPAIQVLWMCHLLDRNGYESTLITGSEGPREGNMLPLAEDLGVKPVRISEMGREVAPLSDIRALWKLYRLMRRERPGIVHTHTAKAGALGRLAAWMARVPIVVHTYHGHNLYGYFSPWKTRLFAAIEKLLARVTTHLVAVSGQVRADLIAAGITPADRISCIPLGLNLSPPDRIEEKRGSLRRRLGVAPDTTLVGIVARLAPVKGHSHFLEAARLFLEKEPVKPILFVIVGDGELRPALETKARRLGLGNQVVFEGFAADMDEVYADLDVLVLSSLNEGLPVAVIEGLASGIPVVASRVGGVPDLLEGIDSAIMVEPGDSRAMAEALETILSDIEAYTRRAARHSSGTRQEYSVGRLADDLDRLYRSLG
jgi:glycosyltransferase involved in cell wall biosynthesis